MNNPNLQARLIKYLKWRCHEKVDEAALDLINDLERPVIICEGGSHMEFLLRRLSPHLVEYLTVDGWAPLDVDDHISTLILAGELRRFYGPLQTAVHMTDPQYEYIVYHLDLNSHRA